MGLEKIRGAFEDVVEKQNSFPLKCDLVVNQIKYELEHALSKLQSDQDPAVNIESILEGLKRGIHFIEQEQKLQTAHEEVEAKLSMCLEVLENELYLDLDGYKTIDFGFQTVNQVIAEHFFLQGMFEIGDFFILEADTPKDDTLRSQFSEMYEILEALRTSDFQLAQNWVTSNHEKLQKVGSNIELMLHQVRFVENLKQGSITDALEYARANFTPFASSHEYEVHKSMAWLMYVGNTESCPDSQLLALGNRESFADELARQFCMLLRRSWHSPLAVTVEAGIEALPATVSRLKRLAQPGSSLQSLIDSDSSVELSNAFQFHSIFVCALRPDEPSNDNPPMKLPCHHVFLKNCLLEMTLATHGNTFFCPYCHLQNLTIDDCLLLHF